MEQQIAHMLQSEHQQMLKMPGHEQKRWTSAYYQHTSSMQW